MVVEAPCDTTVTTNSYSWPFVIIAPRGVYEYLESQAAADRLEERRFSLEPWVNEQTYLVNPDLLVESAESFTVGDVEFRLSYQGSAHSQGDMAMFVVNDAVLYSGDLIFEGRVPFVGDADTRHWLETLQALETGELKGLQGLQQWGSIVRWARLVTQLAEIIGWSFGPMQLIKIDDVGLQPAKAVFHRGEDIAAVKMISASADIGQPVVPGAGHLGCQHDLVPAAAPSQPAADDALRTAHGLGTWWNRVHLGGVDEVDARVEGHIELFEGFLL